MSIRERIPTFAPVFGSAERVAASEHFLTDAFITSGPAVISFENRFAAHIKRKRGVMVQSGSIAAWAAITALDWQPGDRVLTPAVTFPTTITPLLQRGVIPVFVDVDLGTYNIRVDQFEELVKTMPGIKGAVIPHTLGNPVDPVLWDFFPRNTVEDSCDAFGSEYAGKPCGSFGTLSTFSFYPAHHVTTGEGGMVVGDDAGLMRKVERLVSWGRDCWCKPGYDDTCNNRFGHTIGGTDYDHKYIFTEPHATNAKPLEVQGIIGNVQLEQEHIFKARRQRNFGIVLSHLGLLGEHEIIFPKSLPKSDPSWFGFPITLNGQNRKEVCLRIEARGVATRLLFAGNIVRQPLMDGVSYLAPFPLDNADRVMRDTFILPCNHSLTEAEAHKVGRIAREEITR